MKMQRCQKFWESIDFLYLEKEAEQHDKTPCISKVTKNAWYEIAMLDILQSTDLNYKSWNVFKKSAWVILWVISVDF